jgi:hypothetical protein
MEPTQPKSLFLAAFLRKGAFGTVKAITTEDTEDTEEKHRFAAFAVLDFVGESRKGVPDFSEAFGTDYGWPIAKV